MFRINLILLLLHISISTFSQTTFRNKLTAAALTLTEEIVEYDPAYFNIEYPGGDVPKGKGVCTDVIIRAYRITGTYLQKEVHQDMQQHFEEYPKIWGMKKTDPNIDHRRVPNLMKYFGRKGKELPITKIASDYQPGDIVCWRLFGNITHIGLVVNKKSADGKRYLIVHNIGRGQNMEDFLFNYPIIGHYFYSPQ